MENDSQGFEPITCHFGFGNAKQVDMEMPSGHELWIAAGAGITQADVWMKAVVGELDIRIRIKRVENGLSITLDRGGQDLPWWPANGDPRVTLETDAAAAAVSVRATVGTGDQKREVVLDSIPLAV